MTTSRTVRGVYQMHVAKGRDTLVTIALPPAHGRALVEALGPSPSRAKDIPVALAVGDVVPVLTDLLDVPRPGEALDPPEEPFDFGQAVGEIAFLTGQAAMWADIFNAAHGTARLFAREQRDIITTRLTGIQDEFTAMLRAAMSGASR